MSDTRNITIAAEERDILTSPDYAISVAEEEYLAWREELAGEFVINDSVSALCRLVVALAEEVRSLRVFKRSVDEALNMGDGSYRP